MIAPEAEMHALTQLMYRVIINARLIAWGNSKLINRIKSSSNEHLADLMDAIHNVPIYLDKWEDWDEKMFLTILGCYDDKWTDRSGINLTEIYHHELESYRAQNVSS